MSTRCERGLGIDQRRDDLARRATERSGNTLPEPIRVKLSDEPPKGPACIGAGGVFRKVEQDTRGRATANLATLAKKQGVGPA